MPSLSLLASILQEECSECYGITNVLSRACCFLSEKGKINTKIQKALKMYMPFSQAVATPILSVFFLPTS